MSIDGGRDHKDRWSFDQITENIYLGADLCCGVEHNDYLCDTLGVSAEIEIRSEEIEKPNPRIGEYMRLSVEDDMAPTPVQFDVGVAMIDAVVKNGKKVYVHCRLGHGRSPTLVAAYFIFTGLGTDGAVTRVRSKRSVIHPTGAQIEALRKYEERKL